MEESMTRPYRLAKELSKLFDLDSKIDTLLSASMYYLNQFIDSERSSIFIFQHWNQQLTIFSSLDLEKHEISIPKSYGVAGWVFRNCQSAVINNAYEDTRFYKEVDEMTGFQTRNLICTPLLDNKDHCLGTIQSLNKKSGDFTTDDLELLNLAARMVAVAINNSRQYNELLVTNKARKKIIMHITDKSVNSFC
ncbi:GAF domain-containing protein [Desulfosarcina sp.]|uniref:GAF domain-containing protein n=1 Tax=Desulfosarcina sp. TaxID=2027861 RepID=UPI003567A299